MKRVKRAVKMMRGGKLHWDRERERDKKERPSGAPVFVILTQIQRRNMATMWTLSKNSAPVSTQPIRGDKVHGGGTWGGSRGLRENVIKMCEHSRRVHGREAACTGEPDYPQTHGDRLDFSQSSCMISVKASGGALTHLTDITAHKYYVVGQSPTLL